MPAVADAGWRAVAPDFAGYGDSEPDPPATWERHVESVERFRHALDAGGFRLHHRGGRVGLAEFGFVDPQLNALSGKLDRGC